MNLKKILAFIPGYQAWRTRYSVNGGGLAHATIEVEGENKINTTVRSNQALADIRDFLRNTSFGPAILNQLQVNIVGTLGGRLSFATRDNDFNARVNREWARYSRFCGFADGCSLNKILRDLVGCLFFNGGDALVVFDDGRLTGGHGTGKLLVFESDQIANVPQDYFEANFPEGWKQDRGMIFDQYKRHVGFFASAKRGQQELKLGKDGKPKFLTFVDRHPDLDPEKRPFHFISRTWRPNQGRGVPAIIHVINELRNLEDLGKSETQAAKLNASLALAIKEDSSASDAMVVDAIMNGQTPPKQTVKFDAMLRQQSAVLQLPKGKDVVAIDSKRPNDRVLDFIDQNKQVIVAAFGLGKQFYTLTPESSFTAHRGAMQMAWQTISAVQSDLAVFCNWLASQWFYWRRTARDNRLEVSQEILDEIDFSTEWAWPKMPEVDSVSHQNAISSAGRNGVISMRQLNGPEWRKNADEQAIEREYYHSLGLVYPFDLMATGGVVDAPSIGNDSSNEDGKAQNNGNE